MTDRDSSARPVSSDQITRGTWLAIFSAFCYTVSIVLLRDVARPDDPDWAIWVSCLKALPVMLAAGLVLAIQSRRGPVHFPSRRMIAALLATGLAMQFVGNVAFQWSLGLGGLALTVPVSQATLMLSGALLGWFALSEGVSRRSMAAMSLLIVSIAVLSIDAHKVSESVAQRTGPMVIVLTLVLAAAAGIGWGSAGVLIRHVVTTGAGVAATVLLMSVTGVVGLGLTILVRRDPAWIVEQTRPHDLVVMLAAGAFTALAFFSLTEAMKYITIVRVTLLNASQIALTSLSGVVLFDEPFSTWLVLGTGLTIIGLLLIDRPGSTDRPAPR